MHDFKRLDVWRRVHEVTLDVYRATRSFPPEERFGLAVQMRRAAVSVESNIAEGAGRSSDADFARFLSMASGSASELLTQALIAKDLQFLGEAQWNRWEAEINEIIRMLEGLRRRFVA